MKAGIYIYCLLTFIHPIAYIYFSGSNMNSLDYTLAGMILGIQVGLTGFFMFTKSKWGDWLIKQEREPGIEDIDLVEFAALTFLSYSLLIFGILLPFGIYLNRSMKASEIIFVFSFALNTWMKLFESPLYLILTGESEHPKILRRIFFVFLAIVVFIIVFNPLHFNPTAATLVLLTIFCTGSLLFLGIHFYRERFY